MKPTPYPVEAIRDFLDQLQRELEVDRYQLSISAEPQRELIERVSPYLEKYGRFLVPFVVVKEEGGETEEQKARALVVAREMMLRIAEQALHALVALRETGLLDMALKSAGAPPTGSKTDYPTVEFSIRWLLEQSGEPGR